MTAARVPLPSHDELTAEAAALVAAIAAPGKEAPRTMVMLARQPALLAPFLGWAASLALNGAVPKRDHEILALRAAWNCQSAFEWGEHVGYARAATLDDADIARIGTAGTAGWESHETALISAADQLHARSSIDDVTWAALAARYDAPALVEIPMIVGQYTMLSMLTNALGIDAVDGTEPLPPPRQSSDGILPLG